MINLIGANKMDLKTERLMLRKFKEEDWQAVYEYTSNSEVMELG
jgi:RimJ/RimL family protein N-acetyltransferase